MSTTATLPHPARSATPKLPSARLQPLPFDEPITVLFGQFESRSALHHLLVTLTHSSADLRVVIGLPGTLAEFDLASVFHRLPAGSRVVATSSTHPPRLCGGSCNAILADTAARFPAARFAYEPDPRQAIVGTLQATSVHQTVAILWPSHLPAEVPTTLVRHAARWRASLEADDNGCFFPHS